MALHLPGLGRLAGLGLICVLMVLGGFSLWSQSTTHIVARMVNGSATTATAFQQARFDLAVEVAIAGEYRVHPDHVVRHRFERYVSDFRRALGHAAGDPDRDTQRLSLALLREHDAFVRTIMRDIFTAGLPGRTASTGRPERVLSVSPLQRILAQLQHAIGLEDAEARGRLQSFEHRQNLLRTLTLAVFGVGLGALLTAMGVLTLYQRRMREQTAAVADSEQRFRAIYERAALGVTLLSPSGIVQHVNPALQAMLGYDETELEGKDFSLFTHPDDLTLNDDVVQETLAGKRDSYQFDKRYRRKDGEIIWATLTVSAVRAPGGRVRFLVAMIENITERKRNEATLAHQAFHDPLTDLVNRALFQERLQQAILESRRQGTGLAVLFTDLDRFKEINDTFGHNMGDEVLRQMAKRLRATLRESDTVARLGGDEFAILLPHSGAEGATATAEKLVQALGAPLRIGEHGFDVSASVGIALFPTHGDDSQILMQRADVAMYVAKRRQDAYRIYQREQDQNSPLRLGLVHDLREAIEREALFLLFQPKLRLASRQVQSVEALVRWRHPVHGLISPADFIPLAEQSGLMRSLTHHVLDMALNQCRTWGDVGVDLRVAVNLSAQNLRDPELPAVVTRLLSRHGVNPSQLEIEITESTLMTEHGTALATLETLRTMGVTVALDDFGTGYSSLAYLKGLPADSLKIDRSFLQDLEVRAEGLPILEAVTDLAHSLGLEVVAEGVEDQATLELLETIGCDAVQGYGISPPLEADALTAWLAGRAAVSSSVA